MKKHILFALGGAVAGIAMTLVAAQFIPASSIDESNIPF